MTEDKQRQGLLDAVFILRGRGGKNATVKIPKTRKSSDDGGCGQAWSVRCSRGLSLLNGLVRRPPKQARARDTDDLFWLLEYTDLVSVKPTVCVYESTTALDNLTMV